MNFRMKGREKKKEREERKGREEEMCSYFDITSTMSGTCFTKETMSDCVVFIQEIKNRICILKSTNEENTKEGKGYNELQYSEEEEVKV